MEITFKHKSTQKNGINTYSADGYGGSVYLNKSLFAGNPPAEITVSAPDGTFQAGTSRGSVKDVSPERLAKQEEKLKRQQERQEKQQANLKKQQELVERLKKAQGQAATA